MSDQTKFEIHVESPERSRIEVRTGGLANLASLLPGDWNARTLLLVADENVDRIYGASVLKQLRGVADRVEPIVLPAGEATKSVVRLHELWERFADGNANRDAVVVALGGGVIGDLAGFAAATYARGLSWIGLPTSLMAQVDSSIGGKVGINLDAAKNIVGAFWQPAQVVIDPDVLATLGERDFRSGLAEVVKYGVIQGPAFCERLERDAAAILARKPDVLADVVASCVALKVAVVQSDPFEKTGRRAALNYGHTFAHALETVTRYERLSHGEAVSIGMACAAELAQRMGLAPPGSLAAQRELLSKFGLPTRLPEVSPEELLRVMALDKKHRAGKWRFVLAQGIGKVRLVDDVNPDDVAQALQSVRS